MRTQGRSDRPWCGTRWLLCHWLCETGSLSTERKWFEDKEETFYASFCKSSCRSVNWVMWGSCWSRWLLGNGGAPHHWWSLTLPSCCLLTKHSPSWHHSQKASGPRGWEVQGPPALFLCWRWWWRMHLFTNVTPKVPSGWGEGRDRFQAGFGRITLHAPQPLQARNSSFRNNVSPFHFVFFPFSSLWALETCILLLHSNFPELYLED